MVKSNFSSVEGQCIQIKLKGKHKENNIVKNLELEINFQTDDLSLHDIIDV